MADISSVLAERTFTFVVGELKQEFHIHPSVTRGVSEPLYKLMTNGQMEESVTNTASLPEVEPTVFADFCLYSYHSLCDSALCLASPPELHDSTKPYGGLSHFFCRYCGHKSKSANVDRDNYPFCNGAQMFSNMNQTFETNYCAKCGDDAMPQVKYSRDLANFCLSCTKTQTIAEEKLRKLTSGVLNLGKLFLFADMYLIEDLKVETLNKVKHKLSSFPIGGEAVDAVVDLLRYTYEHTTDMEKDGVGPLRKLVATYAVEHAKELSTSDECMKLLSCGGDIVKGIVGPILRK